MKILAFAGSSSTRSINKKLVTYACSLVENSSTEVLDLNDYEMPIFSEDRENDSGIPSLAQEFFNKISQCDALVISFAEHNGAYSAAYKNVFDWCSRINAKVFQGKKLILLATSPGPSGASCVLTTAVGSAPFFSGDLKGFLSVPSFYVNFDMENGCLKSGAVNEQLQLLMIKLNR
ncbi:NADPH-dependent FMN reductase [Psychromonas ossibalaenae]|uniref:NADPH-dependent FMN reductase n=1 Tax=Psychromonas ossibalaenae TaxID=444922 RepID=UPI0003771EB6|nr:NAD(P)H-dependent oxidoreductase [Psychromonas ossibalaenae]